MTRLARITTPIFYATADPHIGHLHSVLLADCWSRWTSLKQPGKSVVLTVGTDEHGNKIESAAAIKGVPPSSHCQAVAKSYKNLFAHFKINYTDFIRTSADARHKRSVAHFWHAIARTPHVKKGRYAGWYCQPDEAFYRDAELIVTESGEKISPSGHPVTWVEEETYLFALEPFREKLLRWIRDKNPVQPQEYQNNVLSWLTSDVVLPEVSISRPANRVNWAIDVPGCPEHKVYVWLDALVNYLTTAGYPDDLIAWPPDYQVIGKDILKFHAVYWPAFLMAADLPLPKRLFCHGHWRVNFEKMSKSKHNVVDPVAESTRFTVDGLRYFLMRQAKPQKDGNYDPAIIAEVLNDELANSLGNLLSRSTHRKMNPSRSYPAFGTCDFPSLNGARAELLDAANALRDQVEPAFDTLHFHHGISAIANLIRQANAFYQTAEPWKHAANESYLCAVNWTVYEILRISCERCIFIFICIIFKYFMLLHNGVYVGC